MGLTSGLRSAPKAREFALVEKPLGVGAVVGAFADPFYTVPLLALTALTGHAPTFYDPVTPASLPSDITPGELKTYNELRARYDLLPVDRNGNIDRSLP